MAIGVAATTSVACAPDERPLPDVQLLVVDTLRADHVALYGYTRDTSPTLNRFAEEAIVFNDVFAPSSWTLPSVGSLFTGLYPAVHGLIARTGEGRATAIRAQVPTLAELMHAAGYRTIAVVTNPWFEPAHGLVRGFEEFTAGPAGRRAEWVHQEARRALASDDPRPVFLYLHYMDVHAPYQTAPAVDPAILGPLPPEYVRPLTAEEDERIYGYMRMDGATALDAYVQAYDEGIRYWDQEFGRWLEWLEQEARLDETILAVVGDHGEEFLEHGGWNHGETLYQEQLWVPWVMRLPGGGRRRIDDRVVSLVDYAPTLFALLGKDTPAAWMGVNVLGSSPGFSDRAVFAQTAVRMGGGLDEDARIDAVRAGHRKSIERRNGTECYDLSVDPREASPLADGCAGDLQRTVQAFRSRSAALAAEFGELSETELSPGQLERLRALGYVR